MIISMKPTFFRSALFIMGAHWSNGQTSSNTGSIRTEQGAINLSKKKWQWMADKNADTLNLEVMLPLVHQASFPVGGIILTAKESSCC
jgi:hypothetical protein